MRNIIDNNDEYFSENDPEYKLVAVDPESPEKIAEYIKNLFANIKSTIKTTYTHMPESYNEAKFIFKYISNKENIKNLPLNLNFKKDSPNELKLHLFSKEDLRKKIFDTFDSKSSTANPKFPIFGYYPKDMKYYSKSFIKMANLTHLENGIQFIEPNFANNLYSFLVMADSPGYACYLLNYCMMNLQSHSPNGIMLCNPDARLNIDYDKFAECANIQQSDIETNIKFQDSIDFKNPENALNYINELINETENGEGFDLIVCSFKNKENTIEKKEKNMHLNLLGILLLITNALMNDGSCVIKLYTCIYKLTNEILFLLYVLFDGLYITKPISSNPRSLERFAICTKYRHNIGRNLKDQAYKILMIYNEMNFFERDYAILDPNIYAKDRQFIQSINCMNNALIERFIINCKSYSSSDELTLKKDKNIKTILGRFKLIEYVPNPEEEEKERKEKMLKRSINSRIDMEQFEKKPSDYVQSTTFPGKIVKSSDIINKAHEYGPLIDIDEILGLKQTKKIKKKTNKS